MNYSLSKTLQKGVYPVALILLVEPLYAALVAAGIQVDKSLLYKMAISGYAVLVAFINWLKNRKKK